MLVPVCARCAVQRRGLQRRASCAVLFLRKTPWSAVAKLDPVETGGHVQRQGGNKSDVLASLPSASDGFFMRLRHANPLFVVLTS